MVDPSISDDPAASRQYSHLAFEVGLEGVGLQCSVEVWPPAVTIAGLVQLGEVGPSCTASIHRHCGSSKLLSLLVKHLELVSSLGCLASQGSCSLPKRASS